MSILLEIRDYIQKFYQKYAAVLNVILRFLAAFITFFATNRVIGFNPYLDHTYTELVFAAVSVVFPAQILLFFEAVFITLHILYVSHYLAFVTVIFFAILYFVYVRFIPKDGYVILSMPVLSSFGAPYILPILLGIIADPIVIIPGVDRCDSLSLFTKCYISCKYLHRRQHQSLPPCAETDI